MPSTPDLRSWVASHRPHHAHDGFPDHVRVEVVRHPRPLREAGRSLASLAQEVGLSAPTVSKWLGHGSPRDDDGFVQVELRPDPEVTDDTAHRATFTLWTPIGYRVEGLDLDALRELLLVLR